MKHNNPLNEFGFIPDEPVDNIVMDQPPIEDFGFIPEEAISVEPEPFEEPTDYAGIAKSTALGAAQGATIGFADELEALARSGIDLKNQDALSVSKLAAGPIGLAVPFIVTFANRLIDEEMGQYGEQYDVALEEARERNIQAEEAHPTAYGAGEAAGAVASLAVPGVGLAGRGIVGGAKLAGRGIQAAKGIADVGVKKAGEKVLSEVVKTGIDKKTAKAVSKFLPTTATEAATQMLGHNILPVIGGVGAQAVQRAGAKFIKEQATKRLTKWAPEIEKVAERGSSAMTSYIFTKSQQDAEFRETMKQLKKEAAELDFKEDY